MIEPDRCKNAQFCQKDRLMDELAAMNDAMIDCRVCFYFDWNKKRCFNIAKCINADNFKYREGVNLWEVK